MVREELVKLLTEHGMTEDYTLNLLEETIQLAKSKKDVTNLMRASEKLMDLHGMNEKQKTVTTQSLEAVETKRLIGDIAEEERKLLAQQQEVKVGEDDKEEAKQEEKGG